jgi:hypothetical protein
MAGELLRPGVEVLQVRKSNSPTFLRPTLAPCVVGPAFEVINVLNSDGTINSKAKYGSYRQLGKTITQSSFPDPRGNLTELDVQESTVRPFLLASGSLYELLMAPGEGFLVQSHGASRAAMVTAVFVGATGLAIQNKTLVLAIDNTAGATDRSKDVTVTFTGSVNLTSQQAADQINAAVGKTVATVTGSSPNDKVVISSPTTNYGADSSVTVRGGGSANVLLALGATGGLHDERVEGSGYRGQDDNNNDTLTPWIEFYQGKYLLDNVDTTFPAAYGLVNVETGVLVSGKAAAVTFGTGNAIPIQVGDYFYADGTKMAGGEISKVEQSRFKVGTINTSLSVADSRGRYTSKVYDAFQVGTLFDVNPFAPTYCWFKATGLDWTKVTPTAGSVAGSNSGVAATAGSVTGVGAAISNTAMAGLKLHVVVTIDGVDTDVQFTFSGSYVDMPAVVTAIGSNITGVTATNVTGQLKLSTVKTGRLQSVTVKADGTANTILGFSTSLDTQGTGTDVMFPAMVTTSGQTSPTTALFGGGAKNLKIMISTDGGVTYPTTQTHTFLADGTIAAVVTELNADAAFTTISSVLTLVAEVVGTEIRIRHTGTGAGIAIKVDPTSTGLGATKLLYTASQTGFGLNGQVLQLQKSGNPHIYNVSLANHSLDLAVAEANSVLGYTVASKSGAGSDKMTVTTQGKGLGAKMVVLAGNAQATLGLSTTAGAGTGRPFPDAYMDSSNNLVIASEIVRDVVTGYPVDQDFNPVSLYVQFKALRKDVSAVAADAGVLHFSDTDTLSSTLDPLTDDNPLGLGLFLCMLNAPTFEVKGLGVDDVTSGAPYGTAAAYTRAAAMLESEEVYALAPLSQDAIVRDLWLAHILAMSAPEQMGERILFFNNPMPTEKNPTVAVSGTSANSTSTSGQLLLDQNPAAGISAAGKNPGLAFATADGVYIEFSYNGTFYRYLVSSVSGSLVNVKTSFLSTENTDGFYSTVALNFVVINAPYSLKVRGATMNVAGSNPTRLDYSLVASAVSDGNAAIKNMRAFSVFPDQVLVDVNGVTKTLPGFYACAAIAGMVASQPAQQGFTNFPVGGLRGVKGTERFSKKQLNVMAGGGTYVLIQDSPDGPVVCRHQLSTDTTAIETRELSITKVVDFVAKFLRLGVRRFIGTQNVNKDLLDNLSTTVQGLLAFLEERGVLNGSNLNQVAQDASQKDTVIIDVTLDVPYPCNYIRLTLVV